MKIKSISCEQFAGVRNRDVSFNDGVNVIYGKNESGKSTLVNLISRTLFQNARIDGRSDKTFKEQYFPAARKESIKGDFADGKITFDVENNSYTLSKEWGSGIDARCMLSTPDGVLRDQNEIDRILREALSYGEGVYSDMLFSSQRNTDSSLQTILSPSSSEGVKKDITDVLSQAFSESDGISIEAIEREINAKIDQIKGKHWDAENDMPAANKGKRWGSGLGEILQAYYAWQDAEEILRKNEELEKAADEAVKDFDSKDAETSKAKNDYERFNEIAHLMIGQNERNTNIRLLENKCKENEKVLCDWPESVRLFESANALKDEKNKRERLDKYASASKIKGEIDELRRKFENQACPTDDQIKEVKKAQNEIPKLENKLCGMNINAVIKMFGSNTVEVTSLLSGQELDINDNSVSISEAVRITVPGVMEMQLSPSDVNLEETEKAIAEEKEKLEEIFKSYAVKELEDLEELKGRIDENNNKIKDLNRNLAQKLGNDTYDELAFYVSSVNAEDIRSTESINEDILKLCENEDINNYITAKKTIIKGYENAYTDLDSLKSKAYEDAEALKNAKNLMNELDDIPEEYAHISDPKKHLKMLKDTWDNKQDIREDALKKKGSAVEKLESFQEDHDDSEYEAENAKRNFEEKKMLLKHWMHIKEVFKQEKLKIESNPMQDLSDSFTKYLSIIADGRISSDFPDMNKLDMKIYSNNNLLDYEKLSEGSKETVSLAFRLAVLDHLFPNGGGVIVFDDPLTDMDAERSAQACELIKKCAEHHQVIFLTCREEYIDMLGGNTIML